MRPLEPAGWLTASGHAVFCDRISENLVMVNFLCQLGWAQGRHIGVEHSGCVCEVSLEEMSVASRCALPVGGPTPSTEGLDRAQGCGRANSLSVRELAATPRPGCEHKSSGTTAGGKRFRG